MAPCNFNIQNRAMVTQMTTSKVTNLFVGIIDFSWPTLFFQCHSCHLCHIHWSSKLGKILWETYLYASQCVMVWRRKSVQHCKTLKNIIVSHQRVDWNSSSTFWFFFSVRSLVENEILVTTRPKFLVSWSLISHFPLVISH